MVSARVESNGTRFSTLPYPYGVPTRAAAHRHGLRETVVDSLTYRGGRISTVAICHAEGCTRVTRRIIDKFAWRCRGCHADSQFSTMRSGAFLTGRMIDRGLATLHRTIFDPVLSHARTRSNTSRLTGSTSYGRVGLSAGASEWAGFSRATGQTRGSIIRFECWDSADSTQRAAASDGVGAV